METTPRQTELKFDQPIETHFDGSDYVAEFDHARLTGQMRKIWDLMRDSQWRTLSEISAATGAPEASASAQLRNFRKPRWGGHTVNKRRRGDQKSGLFEYQLIKYEQEDR